MHSRALAGKFGMTLFVVSLGVLFGSTLIGFIVMRLQIGLEGKWPALPPLPHMLWISTLTIVGSSVSMQAALRSIRNGRQPGLRAGLFITLALGLAFLVLQSMAWIQWVSPVAERWDESNQWRFALTSFYVITGLHAAHVIGGLIPMAVVSMRAIRGRYLRDQHVGVQLCAIYWHFLDGVWVTLFVALLVAC